MEAIYRFARSADDIADEGDAPPAERLAQLAAYHAELDRIERGETPTDPVFGPLAEVIRTHAIPLAPFRDLLSAFAQDVEKKRYASFGEVMDYCRRSANPVGRLLLHLYGVTDALALERSDAICSALQLINFWQDLSVDIPRGRYYLPMDACQRYGVSQDDILARRQTDNATQLIAACAVSARASMQFGQALVHQIPGRAGWELRLVVQGGLRILDRIEALRFATLNQRPTLRWWDVPVMLWRALWM